MPSSGQVIEIYSDGSCHTQHRIGAWAALLFMDGHKAILSGIVQDTTHNRMELTAVIKAIEYARKHCNAVKTIKIFSDSQYVAGLAGRKEKLLSRQLHTKRGSPVQNADLVKELWLHDGFLCLEFIKVKAHQKKNDTTNHNIEVDKLARKLVREAVLSLPVFL